MIVDPATRRLSTDDITTASMQENHIHKSRLLDNKFFIRANIALSWGIDGRDTAATSHRKTTIAINKTRNGIDR
jgi:hypothetical protein